MNEKRILIVEDEKEIRNIIKEYLSLENYIIDEASDGSIALNLFNQSKYDLVVLDVMIPEIDGWTVCKRIREASMVPVILLTAKGEEYDKLHGFDLGADDYMVKPFSPKELLARIKAILKRTEDNNKREQKNQYRHKTLLVDFASHNVHIEAEKIKLTPKEYDLLEYLIRNKNIVLSRDALLDGVWGIDFFGEDRTVDTHVKMLRESLRQYRDLIVTVWGKGYKFEESDD
ncbi:MAG: response regulator transcription factor [Eubacteriaceae bacterium]|nr:response regulator transcription factor [Eubacteriaceae bacterium]